MKQKMDINELTSIEDIKKYIAAYDNSISQVWQEMLFDLEEFGQEYDISDFLEEAELLLIRGKVTIWDQRHHTK